MSNNVRVLARFRPSSKKIGHRKEIKEGKKGKGKGHRRDEEIDNARLDFSDDNKTIVVTGGGVHGRRFNFDYVFKPNSTQEELFNNVAKATIEDIMAGYNGTIFAYGQTGSGKTFTMFGEPKHKGIIPRCAEAIFEGIANAKVEVEEVYIKCSFVEIYQENVRDLLNPKSGGKLKIREKPDGSTYLQGATEEYCNSPEDIYKIIAQGNKHRAVSKTDMNNQSSRSHSVLIINLVQRLSNGTQLEGGLNLADLAGSERVDRTNVTGIGLEEAKKINQSLSALGNCIKALTSKSAKHIPFRDSQLTRLLQDALGGNSKTVLVVCCSPDGNDVFETLSTLRFAERAKKVKNSAKVNSVLSVEEYQKLVQSLRDQLARKDRMIEKLQKALQSGGQLSAEDLESLRSMSAEIPRPVTAYDHAQDEAGQLNMDDADISELEIKESGEANVVSPSVVSPTSEEAEFIQEASEVLKGIQDSLQEDSNDGAPRPGSPAFFKHLSARFLGSDVSGSQHGSPKSMINSGGSFQLPDGAPGDVDVDSAEDLLKSFQALHGMNVESMDGGKGSADWLETPVATPGATPIPQGKTQAKTDSADATLASVEVKQGDKQDTKDETKPEIKEVKQEVEGVKQDDKREATKEHGSEALTGPEAITENKAEKSAEKSPEEIARILENAIRSGDKATFDKFISNVKIEDYITHLHNAVLGGSLQIVEELLTAKADIDAADRTGKTPTMTAVESRNEAAVEFLIEAKANLDQQDTSGLTALMYSATNGSQSITESLVKAKANVNLRDKEGLTAFEISQKRGAYVLSLLEGERKATEEIENKEDIITPGEITTEFEEAAAKGDIEAALALAECHMFGKGVPRDPQKAFELYSSEILASNPKALTELGRCYHFGIGVGKSLEKAIPNYQKAAEMMYPDARCELAWCFAKGEGIPKEPEYAFQIFSEVAESEHAGAICGLGYCYQKGLGVDIDEKKAVALYERSAAKGHGNAYTLLGKCFLTANNVDEAFLLFQKASNVGDRAGKYYLARCYHDGKGVERNSEEAVRLYQEATILGDTEALLRLGRCYMKGDGVKRDSKKAVQLYKRATELDSTGGMISLGDCYERATGVERDFKKAAMLYQQAADKGDARAILRLGECYENAKGVKKSAKTAYDYYRQAEGTGLNEAVTRIAWCFANGVGVDEKDGSKAFDMFTKAMKGGSKEALRGLGFCYEKGLGVKSNLRKAVQMYQQAAEAGNATAWSDLANCVVNASGMSRNNMKAFLLFKKSASMGDAVGNRKLGWCYVKGIGVEKDVKKGVQYYHRAAEMGDSMAISSLGVCYAKGMGVRKDQVKAFELFKRAAEMGNPTDICNLGVCYKKGTGVKVDHKKAAELYQKAADMGDAAAICNLGVCYYSGTGVEKDVDKALSYWHEAARMGNSAAKHNLERCKKQKGDKVEKVLLLASLSKLVPPTMSQQSVMERPLFKEPMTELSPEDQIKRRSLALEALKMTLEQIQAKHRKDTAEAAAQTKAEAEADSKTPDGKASKPERASKTEVRLAQLIESCKVLLDLMSEPKKRKAAPKIVKPIQIRSRLLKPPS